MDLKTLRTLAGIPEQNNNNKPSVGENLSYTGTEKAEYQRKHGIKPGTDEWFRLWFARPYMTGENPMPKNDK